MVTLVDLFTSKFFIIPDYQRGYAWGEKQLIDLWDDINDLEKQVIGGYKPHYMGAVIYNRSGQKQLPNWILNNAIYEIVDGQQRLTTIIILLFELLKKGVDTPEGMVLGNSLCSNWMTTFIAHKKAGDSQARPYYKLEYCNEMENASLRMNVFEDSRTIINSNYQKTATDINLQKAKDFFAKQINALDDEEREVLFQKIMSLSFDVRDLSQDSLDVQAVFETMNNRGKPLTTLEKLKNRLMYLTANKINDTYSQNELRSSINTIWGNIYRSLAQNCNNILDEDDFLSAHLSLYREPKYYVFSPNDAEDKLFKMFCNHSDKYRKDDSADSEFEEPVNYDKIIQYITSLNDFVKHWCYINNLPYNSEEEILAHKILTIDNSKEVKLFLCVAIQNNLFTKELLSTLEKILFRGLFPRLSVMDSRQLSSRARDIYNGEKIDIYTHFNDMLSKPISDDQKESMISDFVGNFNYVYGKKGYYRWGGLKYLLFAYEESLKPKNDMDILTITTYGKTSIEHIIPQMYQENWNDIIESYANKFDEERKDKAKKIAINTLGNLCLVKAQKNSELSNKGWLDKKQRFKEGLYNEREVAAYDEWGLSPSYERGSHILDFICKKIDGLQLNIDDKQRLLFVDSAFYLDEMREPK